MINQAAYDAWVFDQLEPDQQRLYVGRVSKNETPAWATPFPEHLIKNAPPELTDREREEREDDFLRKHGIV